MPRGAIYVGRPTRWGNDFRPTMLDVCDRPLGADLAVELYRLATLRFIEAGHDGLPGAAVLRRQYEDWIAPLRGHDLACWCPLDQPCHADVLLELATR